MMKVKTSAFALDFTNANIYDFLRYLKKDVTYHWQHKILVVDEIADSDGLWAGFLVNLRDSKIQPQVELTSEEIKVILHQIKQTNTHNADFNCFLLNPYTRKGLYQYHAHSTQWTGFSFYLNHRFNGFCRKERLRDATFKATALFRQDTFEEFVKKFEWIREVRLETSSYIVDEKHFQQIGEQAQRKIHLFRFYKGAKWSLKAIIDSLLGLKKDTNTKAISIEGTINGIEQAYALSNNIEVFLEEDFDEWMVKYFDEPIRYDTPTKMKAVEHLFQIYQKTLHLTLLDRRDKK